MSESRFTPDQEKELKEILSAHGLSFEAFLDLRPDSYEQALARNPESLDVLYSLLLSPGLSLSDVQAAAPPWPSGPKDGSKPSPATLSAIGTRIRTERMLTSVTAGAKIMEAVQTKLRSQLPSDSSLQEQMLDQVVTLVGNEVIQQTLVGQDHKTRNASAKILLKRADQRRFDRRMQFLESQVEKTKKVLNDTKLTPEQKQLQMKQIFGMS